MKETFKYKFELQKMCKLWTKAPTTHLILKEMRVLNARMTHMAGQTISPNQKILDSDSDACCFPDVYKKQQQDILTVKSAVNNLGTNKSTVPEVKTQVKSTTK